MNATPRKADMAAFSTRLNDPVIQRAAAALANAWRSGQPCLADPDIQSTDQAYAVQMLTFQHLGWQVAGWKVGSPGADAEPNAAPLPSTGLFANGARVPVNPSFGCRLEVELCVLLGADLPSGATVHQVTAAVTTLCASMEVVSSRLQSPTAALPNMRLADMQSNHALVLGSPSAATQPLPDLSRQVAELWLDDTCVANVAGGNPSPNWVRLVQWLSTHAARVGQPLRAGQWITTGSCMGALGASPGQNARGALPGISDVHCQLVPLP